MLAEKIRNYIESHGLKQNHVACKSDMNVKTFNAIMNGNRKLLADEFVTICENGLNVSPVIFFASEFQENGKEAQPA